MKMLIYSQQAEDPGVEISIPENHKSSVLSWTTASFRKYDFGSILTQVYKHKYYRVYIYRFIISTPVRLFPSFDQHTIVLQFTLKGQLMMHLAGFGEIKLETGRWGMFYFPQGTNEAKLHVGETISFHIELEHPYLDELAEGNEQVALLKRLFEEGAPSGESLPLAYIDRKAQEALAGIMNADETPKELPIELKAHIATLLNLYRKSIREAEEFELLPDVLHKEILIDFAKQIKAAPALRYNINTLARKHRIYYKTLAKSFKELTGFTLKLYVYEQRMHQALSLVTGSQLPFNEIATELGYIEPNNLHRAFVKRFGRTLLEVRNNPEVLSSTNGKSY